MEEGVRERPVKAAQVPSHVGKGKLSWRRTLVTLAAVYIATLNG